MKRIFIWGTGKIASAIIENMQDECIEGFIETKRTKVNFKGKRVYQYDEMAEEYDAIIVANIYTDDIFISARNKGYSLDKLIFMKKCYSINPTDNLEWKREILGEINYQKYLAEYNLYKHSFFISDKTLYNHLNKRNNFQINAEYEYPIIKDKYEFAGSVDSYFWQDLWAAQLIYKQKPLEHYDIGSRLDGFIAHVLSYGIPVHMIDIRPFPAKIAGLDTVVADATNLDVFADNSIESLSALCSLEHFGLGRYGDTVDPEACFKCFDSIQKKLRTGGHLYISVPIGQERVEFNAHRVFYPSTILKCFNQLDLVEFSCANNTEIEINVDIHKYDSECNIRKARFGLFHLKK